MPVLEKRHRKYMHMTSIMRSRIPSLKLTCPVALIYSCNLMNINPLIQEISNFRGKLIFVCWQLTIIMKSRLPKHKNSLVYTCILVGNRAEHSGDISILVEHLSYLCPSVNLKMRSRSPKSNQHVNCLCNIYLHGFEKSILWFK